MLHWDYDSARDADLLRPVREVPVAEPRAKTKVQWLRLARPMRRRRASTPARVVWVA